MNLKELEKLIKLCHKHNIKEIRLENGVELKLGEKPHAYQPVKKRNLVSNSVLTPEQDQIDTMFTRALAQQQATVTENILPDDIDMPDEPTQDQLLFGSSDPTVWDN